MTKKIYSVFATAVILFLAGVFPADIFAATAEEQFYGAEVYYNQFVKEPDRTKYRDNWLFCIQKFQAAYQSDPASALAPASLFMAGSLYQELWNRAGKTSDRREAVDIFRRLVKRFPGSGYRAKAESELKKLSDAEPSGSDSGPSKAESGNIPHLAARSTKNFGYTDNSTAASGVPEKRRGSEFRESKAAYKSDRSFVVEIPVATRQEYRDPVSAVSTSSEQASVIQGLRVWSNPNYTRIVVDADKDTRYIHNLLDGDRSSHKPQRLYIDFAHSRLGNDIEKKLPINDDLLKAARAGQCTPDTVRVVIDIKSFKTYKIFSLRNPFRTVIDVWGQDAGAGRIYADAGSSQPLPRPSSSGSTYTKTSRLFKPEPLYTDFSGPSEAPTPSRNVSPPPRRTVAATVTPPIPKSKKVTPNDLARQFALGVRRIVIDAGHGGHDGGAPGYVKGVKEKDIVLQIARRLARRIRNELNCEVILTRDSDRFLALEERTAIANTRNADLFISIHCNASTSRKATGIETYFLNLATDEAAVRVAARENAISRKNISDLQFILTDLMKNAKINESSRLAAYVQRSLHSNMSRNYSGIRNKGVKQAPFYVLIGAQMPSILIETSFISNKQECERLMNGNYQEQLCTGIVHGVRRYMEETSPTAFLKPRSGNRG